MITSKFTGATRRFSLERGACRTLLALGLLGPISECVLGQGATQGPSSASSITWLISEGKSTQWIGKERASDILLNFLRKRLPSISQQRIEASYGRSWKLIKAKENYCICSAIHTSSREEYAYFVDTAIFPPIAVIARSDVASRLPVNDEGEVQLDVLLREQSIRGLLVSGRSYGEEVDAILSNRNPNARIQELAPADFGSNAVLMLMQGRADYTLHSSFALHVANYSASNSGALVARPIQGARNMIPLAIACPRTEWGRNAITLIDNALAGREGTAILEQSARQLWTKDLQDQYGLLLRAFLEKRKRLVTN